MTERRRASRSMSAVLQWRSRLWRGTVLCARKQARESAGGGGLEAQVEEEGEEARLRQLGRSRW
jgi:hypothetical protein